MAMGNQLIFTEVQEQIQEYLDDITVPNYLRLETVLLIEDSEDLNNSLSLRLSQAGYQVVSALDGLEGLQAIEHHDPDLILLDIGLPKIGGQKLLHELRGMPEACKTPVVVITGLTDPSLEDKLRGFGISRFLRKPIRQKFIVQAVRDVLDGR